MMLYTIFKKVFKENFCIYFVYFLEILAANIILGLDTIFNNANLNEKSYSKKFIIKL